MCIIYNNNNFYINIKFKLIILHINFFKFIYLNYKIFNAFKYS